MSFRKKSFNPSVIAPRWIEIFHWLADRLYGKPTEPVAGSRTIDPDQASNFQHSGLRIIDAHNETAIPGQIKISPMILSANPAVSYNP